MLQAGISRRLIVLLGFLATHSALAQKPAATQGESRLFVGPQRDAEVCLKLSRGEGLEYRFETNVPLDFNLHYHRADKVHYDVNEHATRSLTGQFTASAADTYCLMWRNPNADPADIRLRVQKVAIDRVDDHPPSD